MTEMIGSKTYTILGKSKTFGGQQHQTTKEGDFIIPASDIFNVTTTSSLPTGDSPDISMKKTPTEATIIGESDFG